MTSKQRAYLKGLAMNLEPSFNIGKESFTPGVSEAIRESMEKNELIKIGILKNCMDDPRELGVLVAERTGAELVQVIGKKIVLFKVAKDEKNRKIVLPR